MAERAVCVVNVVGLTPALLPHAPTLSALGRMAPWQGVFPAVTSTVQATLLTGLAPGRHGIVANGWYYRETAEVRFWQQARSLIQGDLVYEGIETAKLFWWFNQHAPVRWSATPKPHYGSDGSKVFGILDFTDCQLEQRLGSFPFHTFWGPKAGLPCSDWISRAAVEVLERNRPELTLVYLPHLDYDFQRYREPSMTRVQEVDRCVARIVEATDRLGVQLVLLSEYGLTPVERPVFINRHLRAEGWLSVRSGPFGEQLMPGDSRAFAVVDHQVAHVYVSDPQLRPQVRASLERLPGVASVVEPQEIGLGHPRSGELIALSHPDSWFVYYHWLDDAHAPDYARTVDIHRKPGYDPCELFMTSPLRAAARLAQKKLGFRYRMDVVPLRPELVGGSHGLLPDDPQLGPLIIGPGQLPGTMLEFRSYLNGLLNRQSED
jgi:predicted AlkP superfamily pyrophosphatase or phosphodiesterase